MVVYQIVSVASWPKVASLSTQQFLFGRHENKLPSYRAANSYASDSIAIINPMSSASKADPLPTLLAKHPKKVPRKSRKIPPQEALRLATEPSHVVT